MSVFITKICFSSINFQNLRESTIFNFETEGTSYFTQAGFVKEDDFLDEFDEIKLNKGPPGRVVYSKDAGKHEIEKINLADNLTNYSTQQKCRYHHFEPIINKTNDMISLFRSNFQYNLPD